MTDAVVNTNQSDFFQTSALVNGMIKTARLGKVFATAVAALDFLPNAAPLDLWIGAGVFYTMMSGAAAGMIDLKNRERDGTLNEPFSIAAATRATASYFKEFIPEVINPLRGFRIDS